MTPNSMDLENLTYQALIALIIPQAWLLNSDFDYGGNYPFIMLFHLTFMNKEKRTRPGPQTDSTKMTAALAATPTAFQTNQQLSRLLRLHSPKRRRSLLVVWGMSIALG
jgi:hypothetical protein